jgi:hypothetical protein
MGEIVLPAGTKMRVLFESLGRMSMLDFGSLFVLYHEVDRASGLTTISHDEVAAKLGCKRRAAERSLARHVAAGRIRVERKRVGARADGTPLYGGRGGKNTYQLLFERPSDGTVFKSETPPPQTGLKPRPARHETPSTETQKPRLVGHDALYPSYSHKNPLRAGANADAGDVFVLEDSADAQAWSEDLRARGKSGTLLVVTHNGQRGSWMPSRRPPDRRDLKGLSDEGKPETERYDVDGL